jgi:hypothetical protein
MKSKKERIPRKFKKANKIQRLNQSFYYRIVEVGKHIYKTLHEGPNGIKYFDNKPFRDALNFQLSQIKSSNKLYLEKKYDWGTKCTLVQSKKRNYHFKNNRVYTGWGEPTNLTKLVCVRNNSTGKVLKLRKGTFNEDLYTYISKQEYKSTLIRKPFKSTKKAIKIDLARTGMSADWEVIPDELTTITFREKGIEYEAEVWKRNPGMVKERRRKLKLPKKERTIKIYEDISREINYDKYRDPNFSPYKCPPIRNEGMKIDKLTRKMVKEKRRLHQIVLKSHIKNRKKKR